MSGITNIHPYGEQGREDYDENLIESESMSCTEGFFSGGPLHFCLSQNVEVGARVRQVVRIGDYNDFSAFLRNFYNYSSMYATDLSISGDRSYTDVSLAAVNYPGYEDVTETYKHYMEYYEERRKQCTISSILAQMYSDGYFPPQNPLIFSNMAINYDKKISGLTNSALIDAICELNGCFAVAGTGFSPSFSFKDILDDGSYATRPKDIQPSQYRNLVYADSEIATISGVVIINGDMQVSAGTVENPYIIRDNMLLYGKSEAELQSIADTLYNKVKNIKFTSASLEIIGMTSGLKLCDCLRVHKPDGDTFITYVLNLKTTGVRSPHMIVDSSCTKYLDDSVSPLKTSVKNLQAAQAKTEDDVEDLQLDNELIKNTLIAQSERIDGKNTEVGLRMADDGTVYQVSENPIITEATGQAIVAELQRIAEGGGSGSAPIETIKVDGTPLPIANKAVNIDLSGKVDKVGGKQLSTEDYTTAEKTKLAGIATGATKTTIANNLTTTTAGSALDASQGKVLSDRIANVTADTSVHQASGTSLSLQTGKGGMRWQDDAIGGQTIKDDTGSIHSAGEMGCVDMGDLSWSYSNSVFYASLPNRKIITTSEQIIFANGYIFGGNNSSVSLASLNMPDKSCGVNNNGSSNNIYFKNSFFTDISTFKDAMRGVYLAYELADSATPSQYALVVEEVEKNLCNFTSDGTMMPLPRTLPAGTYTLSADTSSNVSIGFRMSKTTSTSADSTVVSKTASNNHVVLTIDTNHESNYVNLSGATLSNIQIEKGSVATPYTQFSGKTYPIPLPHPARGIGDVKEIVRKVDGKWVMDGKFRIVDLATLTMRKTDNVPTGGFLATLPNTKNNSLVFMCDRFTEISTIFAWAKFDTYSDMSVGRNGSSVYFKAMSYNTAEEFKAAMSGVLLIYELATPTTEPLPNQASMYELESYTEQTHIDTVDSLATLNVEYGTSDLMATALDGQRIAMRNQALIESK